MKNLILIRHAKSSWDDPSLTDRERSLNKRGKRDAPFMGKLLKERKLQPNCILSSPARRALKTSKLIAREVDYPKQQVEIREEIYEQGLEALIDLIGGLEEKWETVFLIGHNPELTDLANRLGNLQIDNIPTCGIVSIEFSADNWRDCVRYGGRLAFFERPPKKDIDGSYQ